ncbi:MAG: chloride channel protein [Nitrospiraceae bacterium]|nr:chloride channel protein [Nitrospiraceae bacterium]
MKDVIKASGKQETSRLEELVVVLKKFHITEHTALIILSFLVGALAGLANILFRATMNFIHQLVFVQGSKLLSIDHGGMFRALLPLLPMAGALLLVPLSLAFPGEVNGYGFPRFLELVNIRGGVIKIRNILLKTLSAGLTIGSGGSAGIEGPIAIIGGTVGSGIGQLFRASGSRMKLLIAAGSAGAIAATFNAPIAGVMFATEIVLLGNYELSSFAAIVISSGIATVISRGFYGSTPAFSVPQYRLRSPVEIPLYIFFGVLVGILAVFYIRVFHWIKDGFDALKVHPQVKPVIGAFIVGAIGIFLPQVMGNGYEFIEASLVGKMIFPVVLALVFLKLVATSVTIGSGGAGGVFAPSLFIGAMVGESYGHIVHWLFPAYTASPGAYATVGIGSFLAAATHAPLTGIFLLFEMTGNYQIIIPLMFSSIIGTLVAKRLFSDSIDTVEITRKGIKIHMGREVAIMSSIKVKNVMRKDFITAPEDATLDKIINDMISKEKFYIPVVDAKGLMTGIVSFQDVRPVLLEEQVKEIVRAKQIATEEVIVMYPDEDLNAAVERFSLKDIAEVPVVSRDNPQKVIGMLSRGDVISAYNKEVLKKSAPPIETS